MHPRNISFEAKDHVHAIKNGDTSLAIPAPVIMVPGTNGDVDRFDSLVDSLKQTEKGVEEVKITVNKDDSITSSGHFRKRQNGPLSPSPLKMVQILITETISLVSNRL